MTLTDVTNVQPSNGTPTRLKSPFVPPPPSETPPAASTPVFQSFSEDDEPPTPAPAESEAPVAAEPVEISQTFKKTLAGAIQHEHSLEAGIFVAGHIAFGLVYLGSLSLVVNVAAWLGLLYLLCGGVASMAGHVKEPHALMTEEDLKTLTEHALGATNTALRLHHDLFRCGQPKQALKGAVGLYALAVLSAHLSMITLLWLSFTGSFVLPAGFSHFAPQLAKGQALLVERAHQMNALVELNCPKKYSVPFFTLAWLSYSSYTTMALTIGVGCIGVQVGACACSGV